MSSIIKQVASSRYEAFLQQCLLPPEMHLFSRAQYVLCSMNPTKVPFSRNSGAHIWWQMTNLLPHDTQIYFLIIFIISSIDQQPHHHPPTDGRGGEERRQRRLCSMIIILILILVLLLLLLIIIVNSIDFLIIFWWERRRRVTSEAPLQHDATLPSLTALMLIHDADHYAPLNRCNLPKKKRKKLWTYVTCQNEFWSISDIHPPAKCSFIVANIFNHLLIFCSLLTSS